MPASPSRPSRRRLLVAGALVASRPAFAQDADYPARQPIRLIVTFAPGGGTDTIARTLNGPLGEVLRQSVVVENRPGAGGTIATDLVAKAPPDGYTVLFTVSSHSINQALYPRLPFDTERDLRAVALIGELPQVLAVHPGVPADTLPALVELARRDPRFRAYATGGPGSPGHFAGEVFRARAEVELEHVAYKGAGPAITDVIGNQVPLFLGTLSGAVPHVKAGRLKAIAVTSEARSPLLPTVPTFAESGWPGFNMDTWIGMFVPRATPEAVVSRLRRATGAALQQPAVRERIASQAGRVVDADGAVLDARVSAEIREFRAIVQKAGLKPE
ncbi:MAG TPA: tripartite tricarboxylate transporter substrate binding protein [Burkholderiaceae bacterium]|nr:tripartite tricarboxylate transporter substrate binding protein [Burkholderiaceae bacterium]